MSKIIHTITTEDDKKEKYQSVETNINLECMEGMYWLNADLTSYGEDTIESHTNMAMQIDKLINKLKDIRNDIRL